MADDVSSKLKKIVADHLGIDESKVTEESSFIDTAMTEKINDEYKNQLKSKIPLDRFGKPEDIANCAAFLCSDLSNYITGETIHVNGGMYFS